MNHRGMMRRDFLAAGVTLAVAWPVSANAQKSNNVWRIGVIVPGPSPFAPFYPALLQGLRELGYVDGQNIALEPRWIAHQRMQEFDAAATELVKSRVDLIVTGDGSSALAAKNATRTIPIVMAATGADPVEAGLAASLARPGGNITGRSLLTHALAEKRLQLMQELIPSATRFALLSTAIRISRTHADTHEAPAKALGIQLLRLEVRSPDDFEAAFATAQREQVQAVVIVQGPFFATHRARLAEFGLKYGLPTISGEPGYARAGGLIEHGPDIAASWRKAAVYVDRILRGASPGDLPIEQATEIRLVINLNSARALGITIPPALVIRADEVIE